MLEFLIIAILAIIISNTYKRNKYSLELAFLVLTIFFAIRYRFGNDYDAYLLHYELDSADSLFSPLWVNTFEPGWVLLCRLCHPIGFFGMVIALTAFEQFSIYRIIKKYVPVNLHWLALFSFLFSTSLCLTGLSMMRQFLAMCICLYAFELAVTKSYKKTALSVAIVYLASTFHSSAVICLPLCFIGYLKDVKLNAIKASFLFVGCFIIGYIIANYIGSDIILSFNNDDIEKYDKYVGRTNTSFFGFGDIVTYGICYFIIWSQRLYDNIIMRKWVFIFLMYIVINMLTPIAPLISRVGLYFFLLMPILFPSAVKCNQHKEINIFIITIFVVVRLYNYYTFITNSGWGQSFYEYKTIFSVDSWM